jgi:hypothetical protein
MTVESHPSPPSRIASFHTEDVEQVENYRTMSKLALASLLLGLVAPVCLFAPLLFTIPVLGAILCIAALRRIAKSDGMLAGRGAAVCGLAISVVTIAAAMGYATVTKQLRANQASEFSQQWISLLLDGKTSEAFRLTAAGSRPLPPPEPGAPPGRSAVNPYDKFTENSSIKSLVAAGAGANIRFDRTVAYQARPRGQCTVVQNFLVTPKNSASDGKAAPQPIGVRLTLDRSATDTPSPPEWSVLNFENP